MNVIIPAVLTSDFTEFKTILSNLTATEIMFPFVQIDVMDGVFVPNKSFSEREELNTLPHDFDFELHLMVNNPLEEIETWKNVSAVRKVLIAVESKEDVMSAIKMARDLDWAVGLSVNPETPLEAVDPFIDHVDSVLFLTVTPGAQGNPFIPTVGEKIKKFKDLYAHMTCSVDGGVTPENIALISSWGTDYYCVGSALIKQPDIKIAYDNLINSLDSI